MTDGVSIITATGNRPQALKLCAKYVARQDWEGSIQWIVVDDGEPVSEIPALPSHVTLRHVQPPQKWVGGVHTLKYNLRQAILHVEHPLVFFFEDDDYYAPSYLRHQIRNMGPAEIVGEAPAIYYHLPNRCYLFLNNCNHASLCQTGIRASALPILLEACREATVDSFVDIRLWETTVYKVLHESHRCIGMKGLPGREGIGMGHHPAPNLGGGWLPDPDLKMLESWVGEEDAAVYRNML